MADTLNADSVNSLSGVAAAVGRLDEFCGLIASVPMGSRPLELVNAWAQDGGTWYQAYVFGAGWFNVDPAISWRARSFDGMFQAFDPNDAIPNYISKLGVIKGLEDEIRAAGGTITHYQRSTVVQLLSEISHWLEQKRAAFSQSLSFLTNVIKGVQSLIDSMQRDIGLYRLMNKGTMFDNAKDQLPAICVLDQRVVDLGKSVQAPGDTLLLAWTSMLTMIGGISQRLSAAGANDVGNVLQQLDVGIVLSEWPKLAALAQRYRPGPPPVVPPTPPGF
jgi:hypothetical protein